MTKTEFAQLARTLERKGRAITDRNGHNHIEIVQQGNRYTLYSCWMGYRDCFAADISRTELQALYVG